MVKKYKYKSKEEVNEQFGRKKNHDGSGDKICYGRKRVG